MFLMEKFNSYVSVPVNSDTMNNFEGHTLQRMAKTIKIQHLDHKYWLLLDKYLFVAV